MTTNVTTRLAAFVVITALAGGCATYSPRTEFETRIDLQETFLETGVEAPDRWWEDLGDPDLTRVDDIVIDAEGATATQETTWGQIKVIYQ